MYLKSIKALGFKSFADKTNVEFNKEITAIVGPNGSGKSNVVDAIRWVLGEQSVKQLRGSEVMSDVIFSGSSSRNALKKASVTLTFDNSDKYLKSDFDEIEIKREVYKTGENEYYINNIRVRLKDIHDLFLDTGAGQGAFNIISQGNITEIVNSKASERRVIFESAAGVLKYKKRKEEAIKKLDKTKDNLASIKLLIDELSKTVKPLKKQSEDAKKYLKLREEVENIEIALISVDIEDSYQRYNILKDEINSLNKKIEDFSKESLTSKIEKLKLEIIKNDDKISDINTEIIKINEEINKLSSEKQITIERQKYSNNKGKINESLVILKEKELEVKNKFDILNNEITNLVADKSNLNKEVDELTNLVIKLKIKKSTSNSLVDAQSKELLYLQNKIEITENNIINGELYPKGVSAILNNPKFDKVHDIIGNLIEVPEEYKTAIGITLGQSVNFIVVDDFSETKKCIDYLKNNNLGRVTFFPLDTIKSRLIDKKIIEMLNDEKDFIGIASQLVKFDKKYKNIIENQLGNVIVVKDIDSLNKIGKKLEYKYRIISLDGEILYAGGAVSGGKGNTNKTGSKQILKDLKNKLEEERRKLAKLNEDYETSEKEYQKTEEKIELLNKKNVLLNESINNKKLTLKEHEYNLENISFEIKGMDNTLSNSVEEELIRLIEVLTEKAKQKIVLEQDLEKCKEIKHDLHDEVNSLEVVYRQKNTESNRLNVLLKDKEISIGKLEVKLENLLNILSEDYNLTFDAAKEKYFLDLEKEEARIKVKSIKKEMDKLGDVNLGSIAEYERINERYEFLVNQEKDLIEASDSLLSIIVEMDDIMIKKFDTSFKAVSKEFKKVFKEIFQGGKGELTLTDPENLLTTGVEIIAEPPGKKISSTIALSGGEKSLTAICLLFSILNVRPVPFIILDEAEAALDEANVDMFGKYINDKKKESQFILITHKKRMMEYADSLYGITMQESGVSKLVSTKLER